MSDVSPNQDNQDPQNTPAPEAQEASTESSESSAQQEADYVSKKAYQEVSSDMHKYKSKLKEREAQLNQLLAEKEAQERARLEEEGRHKELAEKEAQARRAAEEKYAQLQANLVDSTKKNAVIDKLGGFKKSEYAQFIKLDNVEIDENGLATPASVEAEVNRIRSEHPSLLKQAVSAPLPSEAPKNYTPAPPKPVEKMSREERAELRKQLLKGNAGKIN